MIRKLLIYLLKKLGVKESVVDSPEENVVDSPEEDEFEEIYRDFFY